MVDPDPVAQGVSGSHSKGEPCLLLQAYETVFNSRLAPNWTGPRNRVYDATTGGVSARVVDRWALSGMWACFF